jgi:hypothetical protein
VLEPLWDGLLRNRASIRALLAGLVLALTAGGSAAILSGRWLTIASALAAAALGIAALATRERRLLVLALPTLGFGVVHAAAVEAPLTTLALEPGLDPLAPIASLVALAAGAAVLALTCRFGQRGIALLGPLDGPERNLDALDGQGGVVLREGLLVVASVFAAWAAGLACVGVSYPWGQVAATSLWACLGVALVVRGAAVRAECEIVGFGVVALAFLKSVAFDWGELGATGASTSLLVVSAALLAAGFLGRWLNTHATEGLEHAAVASAVVATASAVVGLHRLVGDDPRAFGGALLVLVAVLALVAVPPFRRWRELREPWARAMATGYWLLALVSLLLAETALASFGPTRSLTLWAATATALAFTSRPLGEPRLWHAALLVGGASTAAVLAGVTPPDRLVEATAHPGAGFSALLTCVAAAAVLAWTALPRTGARPSWLSWAAAATAVYAASLAVLEIAERVSGASVETDFQRGHTALSTLLGLAALGVYAVGLARDDRSARIAGLTLFGLALAKLFLYDLSSLSSITRALSFLGLGAVLLAAAFFAERVVRGDRDSEEGNTAAWPTSGAG